MSKFLEAYHEGVQLREEDAKEAARKLELQKEKDQEKFDQALIGAKRWLEEDLPDLFREAARNHGREVAIPRWGDEVVDNAYVAVCAREEDLEVSSHWIDQSGPDDLYPEGYYAHVVRVRMAKI